MNARLRVVALLLALQSSALLWAEGPEILEAARNGDLGKVKALIAAGADVNVADPDMGGTPLCYAIEKRDLDLARLLIAAGADVNAYVSMGPGPSDWPGTLIAVALDTGSDQMVRLLLEHGASRGDMERWYELELLSMLERDDASEARALLSSAIALPDQGIELVGYFECGSTAVHDVIAEYYPGIQSSSFLSQLLARNGSSWAMGHYFPRLRFPLATSYLRDDKTPLRYATGSAFDGDLSTSWVEGKKGAGIGEKIAFAVTSPVSSIAVVPGYGDARFYLANNRLKRALLTVYVLRTEPGQMPTMSLETVEEHELAFRDAMEYQELRIGDGIEPDQGHGPAETFCVLEVLEVYPGSTWDDTCIAEIRLR